MVDHNKNVYCTTSTRNKNTKKNLYAPCLSYDLLQKCMELHFWNHRHIILIVGKDKRKKMFYGRTVT